MLDQGLKQVDFYDFEGEKTDTTRFSCIPFLFLFSVVQLCDNLSELKNIIFSFVLDKSVFWHLQFNMLLSTCCVVCLQDL